MYINRMVKINHGISKHGNEMNYYYATTQMSITDIMYKRNQITIYNYI